jgi:hypothetical protein
MDKLLKQAKLKDLIPYVEKYGITVDDLYSVVSNKTKRVLEKIKDLIPEATIFECHKLKACILDLEKAGKINEYVDLKKHVKVEETKELPATKSDQSSLTKSANKSKKTDREQDTITPDKKGYGEFAYEYF